MLNLNAYFAMLAEFIQVMIMFGMGREPDLHDQDGRKRNPGGEA